MKALQAATERVVVIGNGMAGARLVQEIRVRDPQHRIRLTVFGAEPRPAYNRVLLSNVLAGRARPEDIDLSDADWHRANGVDLRTGVRVLRADRAARLVYADDGTATPYDRLVLATGSRSVVPPVRGLVRGDGVLCSGVAVFRTLDDCRAILALAERARQVVVVGGGLLGLEAARGLAGRGLPVTVLQAADHVMDRQLDPAAGSALTRTLATLDVRVLAGARVVAVHGEDRLRSVELADGGRLAADLVVLACGVEAETGLGADCGLAVDRGILVDDELRSVTDRAVLAIGECAQHAGQVYGLVAPAWEQARVAADLLTGADPGARYTGSRVVTRLKAAGVELAAMGETLAEDDSAEVLRFVDLSRGTYKKLVIRGERLVGAILLGEVATVGTVTQLFDRGTEVPTDRLSLLFAGRSAATPADTPAHLPDRAVVCQCNGVTKSAITRCWLAGARSVDAVSATTRAGTGCGSCRDTVEGLVDWLARSDADALPA
jgi:assimilatory nitrate reductase electron transfer subunit